MDRMVWPWTVTGYGGRKGESEVRRKKKMLMEEKRIRSEIIRVE
jgi:hypothetical protein